MHAVNVSKGGRATFRLPPSFKKGTVHNFPARLLVVRDKRDQFCGLHVLPPEPHGSVQATRTGTSPPRERSGTKISELRWRSAAGRSAAEESKDRMRREVCG